MFNFCGIPQIRTRPASVATDPTARHASPHPQDVTLLRRQYGIAVHPVLDTQQVLAAAMAAWAGSPLLSRQLLAASPGLALLLQCVGLSHDTKEDFKNIYKTWVIALACRCNNVLFVIIIGQLATLLTDSVTLFSSCCCSRTLVPLQGP